MSKYTREQLTEKAQAWVVDHTAGGEKSFQVVMRICIVTGMAANDVCDKIRALAEGIDCHA